MYRMVDHADLGNRGIVRLRGIRSGLMQDEIVARIARTVGPQIIDEEARCAARKDRAANPNAADLAMRGWGLRNRAVTRETNIAALGLFQDALRIDDQNVDALVGVAQMHASDASAGFDAYGNEERLPLADEALVRALALDPSNVRAALVPCFLRRTQGRFEEAIRGCETAIAANPASPQPYEQIGISKIFLGQAEQAFAWFEQADRLGPRDPFRWTWFLHTGMAHFYLGHDVQAIDGLRSRPRPILVSA
jgi:tetratricopeptide (TPR) repeat protein